MKINFRLDHGRFPDLFEYSSPTPPLLHILLDRGQLMVSVAGHLAIASFDVILREDKDTR